MLLKKTLYTFQHYSSLITYALMQPHTIRDAGFLIER